MLCLHEADALRDSGTALSLQQPRCAELRLRLRRDRQRRGRALWLDGLNLLLLISEPAAG